MLAYVFWHRPRPEVDGATYEARLREFHAGLALRRLPAYHGSAVARTAGVPWLAGNNIYEDWYLLTGSGGLDDLNEAVTSAALVDAHDAIARLAAAGTAGLYRLRVGDALVATAGRAWWSDKPAGMSYPELWRTAASWLPTGAGLWGRQMTLGPTPELCVLAAGQAELPGGAAITYDRWAIGDWRS